ncbi:ABC-type Fe3+-hydroxamate transport system, substrate-binding protein [Paenibacillus algorifonticola]|uniref:ABC-type Fe3+-hydroxamate transport system, substrate-binding protein n=1 Tax=Paenibacillus algorifonticola TaxID=684063 RepID=A0A1I2GCS9_9BACL|nr:helix-turn-helix domain-containing protein [Paenibacillus algorifonticola]SFF14800.1 ABC-type Fe3+-hydroxamate transport system, substrate-binding protein [Paenibacillus algorifonticola]
MNEDEEKRPLRHAIFYRLTDVQYVELPDRQEQELHAAHEHMIITVTGGTGALQANGERHALSRGACYIFSPNIRIVLTYSGSDEGAVGGLSYYCLTFDSVGGEKAKEVAGTAEPDPFPCLGEVACSPFSYCVSELQGLYEKRHEQDELEAFRSDIRFQQLLLFIMQKNLPLRTESSVRRAMELSIAHIKQNYREELTVDKLAEQANMVRWRYSRLFKELTGEIPLHYLNAVRVEQAKKLLASTDDRLFNIAQSVGYSNEYYFSRRFKQSVGLTPGQYRRHQRENIRVFAPFIEDYVLALGIRPIMQFSHDDWGRQEYLGLDDVPEFNVVSDSEAALSDFAPEFIMLDSGIERWGMDRLTSLAPSIHLTYKGEEWRSTLYSIADLLGRVAEVRPVIADYENKATAAKAKLSRSIKRQTVACLRLSAQSILLYGGPDNGYTGPVLYRDLGLTPHSLVEKLAKGKRFVELSMAELVLLDADHLFITIDTISGRQIELLQSPLWRSLPAVRNGSVYEVDFLSWMNYGVLSHHRKIDDVLRVLS